ncbi:MAG: hypothetical protein JKY80_04810 [Mariprofundaceae bacterium]|nr:hypothetical protein [Mariprofundaceae bacterium]
MMILRFLWCADVFNATLIVAVTVMVFKLDKSECFMVMSMGHEKKKGRSRLSWHSNHRSRYHSSRNSMRGSLRQYSWDDVKHMKWGRKSWKKPYRFCREKVNGEWKYEKHVNKPILSCLIRSGHERLRVKFLLSQSLFKPRVRSHPEKHWVDFGVRFICNDHWIEYDDVTGKKVGVSRRKEYEVEIYCMLDGRECIDLVGGTWVEPACELARWICVSCMDTDDSNAPEGYVKASFDTLEELLKNHLEPVLTALQYLYSHSHVKVSIDDLIEISGGSTVFLNEKPIKASRSHDCFMIPIGKIQLLQPTGKVHSVIDWMYGCIADYCKKFV